MEVILRLYSERRDLNKDGQCKNKSYNSVSCVDIELAGGVVVAESLTTQTLSANGSHDTLHSGIY